MAGNGDITRLVAQVNTDYTHIFLSLLDRGTRSAIHVSSLLAESSSGIHAQCNPDHMEDTSTVYTVTAKIKSKKAVTGHRMNDVASIKDYDVYEIIGHGSFASVYRGKCKKTGQTVAVKMIDIKCMEKAKMTKRVQNEIEIHYRLKHRSILELYDYFQDDNYVYMILEYCQNGGLNHYLSKQKTLTEKEACHILRQVIEGIQYLHKHNIVHRDLSLANLLLTSFMDVKIADFGLSVRLDVPDEKHYTMCGTPNYIAPEIASRGAHGKESDIWSFGCLMYTLLVGAPPFDTKGIKATLEKIVRDDFYIPEHLSTEASDLIFSLLKKHPSKRPTIKDILQHPFIRGAKQETTPIINKQVQCNPLLSVDSGHVTINSALGSRYSNGRGPIKATYCPTHVPPPVNRRSPLSIVPSRNSYDSFDDMGVSKCGSFATNSCQLSIVTNGKDTPLDHTHRVPPLCTARLKALSKEAKSATVEITDSGHVIVKRKKNGGSKFSEIFRVSSDGQQIDIYRYTSTERSTTSICTGEYDGYKLYATYTYNELPINYWKKYKYALQFVKLVQSKTPKVTVYSDDGKCMLMESGDYEMAYNNGDKLYIGKGVVTYKSPHSTPVTCGVNQTLPENIKELYQAAIKDYEGCKGLETMLESSNAVLAQFSTLTNSTNQSFFPVVLRRSTLNKGGSHELTKAPPTNQSTCSATDPVTTQQLTSNNKITEHTTDTSTIDRDASIHTVANRGYIYATSPNGVAAAEFSDISSRGNLVKSLYLPHIGWGLKFSSGECRVRYNEGGQLELHPSGTILYTDRSGHQYKYFKHDKISETVEYKLKQTQQLINDL